MATCKDCLHFEACVDMLQAMGFTVDGDGYLADRRCPIFKDKSGYSEVVRCKDCKEYNGHRYCTYFAETVLDDDFCSYGERKDDDG